MPERKRRLPLFLILLPVLPFLYGYWEAGRVRLEEREIFLPNLPSAFDGFRILHLSDLHCARYGALERRLSRLLDRLDPDAVCMTGDVSNLYASEKRGLAVFGRILSHIRPKDGIWAVRGNYDSKAVIEPLRAMGVRVLENGADVLRRNNDTIVLIGVGDPYSGAADLQKALHGVPGGAFRILLVHTPDFFPGAKAEGIDLTLAGHTHGGQVRLPLLGPVVTMIRSGRRYASGLVREEGSVLYVSRGIGTTGLPVRLLCPPEVTLLTLRRGDGKRPLSPVKGVE